MITGFFLTIFYQVIAFVVSLLPVIAYPTQIASAVSAVGSTINAWTFIFPVSTLFTVLAIYFTFHGTVILWNFGHMVARYLRGR